MSSRLKASLQYILIILVTVFLIWLSLRGLHVEAGENKWDYLLNTWRQADKGWLLLMAAIAILSHVMRAVRWKMLIAPTGHTTTTVHSFLSLMVGYLVNLVIPRGGEVSRCYNLFKLDKVPVDVSFGTVVTERVVDLLCLLLLIGFAFVMESTKLFEFIDTLPFGAQGDSSFPWHVVLYITVPLALLVAAGYWLVRHNRKIRDFMVKTWAGIKKGLLSIFRLEHKGKFILYSIFIWFLYFLMSYCVLKAFPATAHLGFSAVISLFGIGSIAMAAPLPGGTGSYHVLVPQGLFFLYNIPRSEAVAFTFIFHGWQTLIMIVGGALSLIVTSFLVKKSANN